MLAALGLFVFDLTTAPFEELERDAEWRHTSEARFGVRPGSQYLGPGDDQISLTGALVPEIAGSQSAIETIRAMGDQGEAYPLVDGAGRVFGHYKILRLREHQGAFLDNGVPRRIDFSIELQRDDD
jgi:phage protein U